jgi:hypothetical protein
VETRLAASLPAAAETRFGTEYSGGRNQALTAPRGIERPVP